MAYEVRLTFHAMAQVQEAVSYISKCLLEPEIAQRWADFLEKELASLDTMPARFPLIDEEPWHARGIHRMPVKNFVVYYLINEVEKTVWITAVTYGRRDQITALQSIPL